MVSIKTFIVIQLVLWSSIYTLNAQEISYPEKEPKTTTFILNVDGIQETKGEIRIALFNSKESYKSKEEPLHAVVVPVEGHSIRWTHESLPVGDYAIAVYHDKNQNGELDSNILGIPKEAYGFSNDARGKFGPASWEDAHFMVTEKKNSMNITVR